MKIRYNYLILIFLFVCCGCSYIKVSRLVGKQKISFTGAKANFINIDNRILVRDGVDFYLDTGAPNVIFNHQSNKFDITDSINLGSLEKSNGREIENKSIVIEKVQNGFFTIEEAVFRLIEKENDCLGMNGIIGCELFQDKILLIDFQNSTIQAIENYQSEGYQEMNVTDFDGYYFFVEIPVNNHTITAKVDTGNPYGLLLKKQDFEKVQQEKSYAYFKRDNKVDTVYMSRMQMNLASSIQDSVTVLSNNLIKRNLIGVDFMKNYNWILDFKEGKIFFKPTEKKSSTGFFPGNRAIIRDGRLIFYQTNDPEKIRFLDKEITSVNNRKTTPDNLCEIQKLLNETEDWNTLNIEIGIMIINALHRDLSVENANSGNTIQINNYEINCKPSNMDNNKGIASDL